jgi:hypothetical protein
MKGSTVDRSVLEQRDKDMIRNGKKEDVMAKYRKKILKDNDFKALGLSFKLTNKIADEFQKNISNDAEFLKGYKLTDYSILLSIHKYTDEDEAKTFKNYRIIKSYDNAYLYNFSIIDFFCVRYILFIIGIWN